MTLLFWSLAIAITGCGPGKAGLNASKADIQTTTDDIATRSVSSTGNLPCAAGPIARIERVEGSAGECIGAGSWSARYTPIVNCRFIDSKGAIFENSCLFAFPCGPGTLVVTDALGREGRSTWIAWSPPYEGSAIEGFESSDAAIRLTIVPWNLNVQLSMSANRLNEWPTEPADVVGALIETTTSRATSDHALVLAPGQTTSGRPLDEARLTVQEVDQFPDSLWGYYSQRLLITRGTPHREVLAVMVTVEADSAPWLLGVSVGTWIDPRMAAPVIAGPFSGTFLLGVLAIGGCRNAFEWRACERNLETQEERWVTGPTIAAPCPR